MTDLSRRKLLLSLAAMLPAAYLAPQVLVGKAHAASPSIASTTPTDICDAEIALRPYYPAEMAGIDDSFKVKVNLVCEGESLMRSAGNGEGLRKAIAANPVLVAALEKKNFTANDVFGVRINTVWKTKKIILEVHHFNEY